MGHLTLTGMMENGNRKEAIYSNWNPVSKEIFGNMRADIDKNLAIPA